jgi:hypothetical protein
MSTAFLPKPRRKWQKDSLEDDLIQNCVPRSDDKALSVDTFRASRLSAYAYRQIHYSDDKALSVDNLRASPLPENAYRQIHSQEQVLRRFIGAIGISHSFYREQVFETTGVVDARSKLKLYVTVKAATGDAQKLVLPRKICAGEAPKPGGFIKYRIFREDNTLTHEITTYAGPDLSQCEVDTINSRIDRLKI